LRFQQGFHLGREIEIDRRAHPAAAPTWTGPPPKFTVDTLYGSACPRFEIILRASVKMSSGPSTPERRQPSKARTAISMRRFVIPRHMPRAAPRTRYWGGEFGMYLGILACPVSHQ
jgi:hypothetical protein